MTGRILAGRQLSMEHFQNYSFLKLHFGILKCLTSWHFHHHQLLFCPTVIFSKDFILSDKRGFTVFQNLISITSFSFKFSQYSSLIFLKRFSQKLRSLFTDSTSLCSVLHQNNQFCLIKTLPLSFTNIVVSVVFNNIERLKSRDISTQHLFTDVFHSVIVQFHDKTLLLSHF